ncbi:hypothetical protein FHS15_001607 [Paenibacillus castaneae]|nr:hypothetical protein [Paenibacillus castaneae]
MRIVKHIILWFFCIICFTIAAVSLEMLEGFKITTTEYYGLRNLGLSFIFMVFLVSLILYPIFLFPLSWVIRFFVKSLVGKVFIFSCLGVIGGILLFHELYDDYFVLEYVLNMRSSILLFGFFGFIYALLENYLHNSQESRS